MNKTTGTIAGLLVTILTLQAQQAAPLRVGVAPTMPPMIFKEGKSIAGVEADLAKALGSKLGRSITFVELPWSELLDALDAGKIDIVMSSMSITRARQARTAFSDPYLRVGQMALARGEEGQGLLGTGLKGKKIGIVKGTTSDLFVQQEFPRANRKYFESGDEAAKALIKKKIDLYLSDSTMIWYLAGRYEAQGLVPVQSVFSNEALGWAVKRSDMDLLESVNKALREMMTSGELKKILLRWIPRFQ